MSRARVLGMALLVNSTWVGANDVPGEPAIPAAAQRIIRAGEQAPTYGAPENFTGRARVDPLAASGEHINASLAYVTFDPGSRSAWHTHPAGQRLVVTAGVGRTQEWGQPVQVIRPGDVVWCPAGIKHWHGAAPDVAMTHLTLTGSVDGKTVSWMEHVPDAQYRARADAVSDNLTAPVPAPEVPVSETLSVKQQAIPLIAASMAASDMSRLRAALDRGLDAGLTISEVKEVLMQLYAYVGFPKSLNALGELLTVVEARKQRGVRDAPGREPSRNIPTCDRLIAVGLANQTTISGGPVKGPVFDFAPVINQFLQAHLFGDIFERDNLDWQSRELATVGALAATPGVEAQLRSHLRASLRVGLTAAQLRQLVQVLADRGDADAAKRVGEALTLALAAASGS